MNLFRSASMALVLGPGARRAAVPTAGQAQIDIGVSVGFAPPPLPIYEQPAIPGYGYIWAPGYWAWDPGFGDYYWVPGAWVRPPRVGLLWTPGWWGWHGVASTLSTPVTGVRRSATTAVLIMASAIMAATAMVASGAVTTSSTTTNVNNITRANITNVYDRPVGATAAARTSFNGPGGVQVCVLAATARLRPRASRRGDSRGSASRFRWRAANRTCAPASTTELRPSAATARAGVLTGPGVVRASPASATYRAPPRPAGGRRPAGGGRLRAAAIPGRRARRNRVRLRRGQTTPGLPCKRSPP